MLEVARESNMDGHFVCTLTTVTLAVFVCVFPLSPGRDDYFRLCELYQHGLCRPVGYHSSRSPNGGVRNAHGGPFWWLFDRADCGGRRDKGQCSGGIFPTVDCHCICTGDRRLAGNGSSVGDQLVPP